VYVNVHQTHLKDPADFPDTKKPGLIANPGFSSKYRLYQTLSLLLFQSPTPGHLANDRGKSRSWAQ